MLAGVQPGSVAAGELAGGLGRGRGDGGDPLGDVEGTPPGRGEPGRLHRGVELVEVGGRRISDDLGRTGRVVHRIARAGTWLRLAADREGRECIGGCCGHRSCLLDLARSPRNGKSL